VVGFGKKGGSGQQHMYQSQRLIPRLRLCPKPCRFLGCWSGVQTKQKGHFQNQISTTSQGEGNGSPGGWYTTYGITGKPRGGWAAPGGEGRDEEKKHKEDLKKPRHSTHSSLYSKHVGGILAFLVPV